MLECDGCEATTPKGGTEGWYFGPPHPDDGLPDVLCPSCSAVQAEAEAALEAVIDESLAAAREWEV
jgi:uncharacterized protein CbrC (UPF0167 family)